MARVRNQKNKSSFAIDLVGRTFDYTFELVASEIRRKKEDREEKKKRSKKEESREQTMVEP